ncbi:MAG: DUF1759 domain-containing protein [Kangiellaceae bacterium]|jgi:transposase InsO family protein|nr:DUF1759 domain-containing protein [Kangiellaceae bacterium]
MDAKTRGVIRTVATKLLKRAERLLQNDEFDTDEAESLLQALQQKKASLLKADAALAAQIKEEELDSELEATMQYELDLGKTIAAITRRLKAQTMASSGQKPASAAAGDKLPFPTSVFDSARKFLPVKLPKLQLPTFDGDRTQWTSFWDRFCSSIHENCELTPADKFNYLLCCLTNEAKNAVAGLTITNDNYSIAIDSLNSRFGSRDAVVREHLAKFSTLQCSNESVHQLRHFYDNVNVNVRSLQNLDVGAGSYETMLLPMLLAKLPAIVRISMLKTARTSSTSIHYASISNSAALDSVDKFLKLLEIEILVREDAGVSADANVQLRHQHKQQSPTEGSVSVLHSKAVKQEKMCVFCNGDHASESCTRVKDVATRLQIVKDNRRCFCCQGKGHNSKKCFFKRTCANCQLTHHPSLCDKAQVTQPEQTHAHPRKEKDSREATQTTQCATTLVTRANPLVVLPTARAVIRSPVDSTESVVRILFDTASNRSFIHEDLADKLRLKGTATEMLEVTTFGATSAAVHCTKRVEFQIRRADSDNCITLNANTVPKICSDQPVVKTSELNEEIQQLDLAEWQWEQSDAAPVIQLLIGADQFYKLVNDRVIRTAESNLVAMESKLGWLLCGELSVASCNDTQQNRSNAAAALHCSAKPLSCDDRDRLVDRQVEKFWKLESIGITESPTEEDEFKLDIKKVNERYSVSIPWKPSTPDTQLPDNFDVAFKRLQCNLRRMRQDPKLLREYHSILMRQKEIGVVEEAATDKVSSPLHYLPHRAIVREDAGSTKVRVVFDASARANRFSASLNDCLQTGDSALTTIPRLLQAFRIKEVALTADVEKAFLQIRVDEKDRDALRFLWTEDPLQPNSPIIVMRYAAVVFGLTCSPAILERVIQHHISRYNLQFPKLSQKLQHDFYVDNLVTGCCDEEEARELFDAARLIFREAGMNLRHWQTNSQRLLRDIQASTTDADIIAPDVTELKGSTARTTEDSSSYSAMTLGGGPTQCKVLGLQWDTVRDVLILQFSPPTAMMETPQTKRTLLQLLSRVYDPLGLLAPVLTWPKAAFQALCVAKTRWDDPLPQQLEQKWLKHIRGLQATAFEVSRRVSTRAVDLQLHGFCDASAKSYAACVYLRAQREDSSVTSQLIIARSRVTPLTVHSIPRLELLGALILARLLASVKPLYPTMSKIVCWTDSADVIFWIREPKPWKTFVNNRVVEIRQLVPEDSWRHVPGDQNPADIASRGLSAHKLQQCGVWWQGPKWLLESESSWPQHELLSKASDTATMELKKHESRDTTVHAVAHDLRPGLQHVMTVTRFSSWNQLVRVSALVMRFVKNLKSRISSAGEERIGPLTAIEIQAAEEQVIREAQQAEFHKEIGHILRGSAATNISKQLNLFLDSKGLLRSRGRLRESRVSFATDCPLLIPSKSHLECLLIEDAHRRIFHGGVASTLCKLREKFWLVKGRQRVKAQIGRCVTCKRVQGQTFAVDEGPPLPEMRVNPSRAFEYCGVDYCGPVKFSVADASSQKGYIVLFTCAATRAIHIEFVTDMTSATFLRALRRFCARRGIPAIVSDNAKTFVKAAEILQASDSACVRNFCRDRRISWSFITERAPWQGAFWERLIKEVKLALRKTILRALLDFDEFQTLLTEVEAVLNSRPLLYVDAEHGKEVLTPAHFLVLNRLTKEADPEEAHDLLLPLPTRMRRMRARLMAFWDCWQESYLTSLREKPTTTTSGVLREARVGDVVLVKGEAGQPRLTWCIGVIEEVRRGRDGAVRSATVRVVNRSRMADQRRYKSRDRLIRRPVVNLVPLEVKATE